MRRDYVTLAVRNTDASDQLPTVELTVDEQTELLDERLLTAEGDRLDADRVDVAFRLRTPVDAEDASGVLGLSDRITGEFVLEANADADAILDLVDVARAEDADGEGDGCYRVVIVRNGEPVASYGKRMLLVYDDDGNLVRQHSLIPSGVEL